MSANRQFLHIFVFDLRPPVASFRVRAAGILLRAEEWLQQIFWLGSIGKPVKGFGQRRTC